MDDGRGRLGRHGWWWFALHGKNTVGKTRSDVRERRAILVVKGAAE